MQWFSATKQIHFKNMTRLARTPPLEHQQPKLATFLQSQVYDNNAFCMLH